MLLCIIGSAQGQPTDGNNNKWSNEQWEKAKEGKDYSSDTYLEKKSTQEDNTELQERNWDDRILNWLNSDIVKVISILLFIGILVYVLYQLMGTKNQVKNSKLVLVSEIDFEKVEDNLPESNLETYLQQALHQHDYKQAIRIHFLSIIQLLHQLELINWQRDKTNYEYAQEMMHQQSYDTYQQLMITYEIVWYGDTQLTHAIYQQIAPSYTEYKKQLTFAFTEKK